jgi:sterol desaturase/sphingolipid hydroxylase (fatty acid hydroxylase superfamily)
MGSAAETEGETIEVQFVRIIKYIDLYLRQKTDLFLQDYVFEPANFFFKQLMYLSVIVTLLVAGIIIVVVGVILFIATLVPLWAALLITGVIICGIATLTAHLVLSNKIVLNTHLAKELIKNGKP